MIVELDTIRKVELNLKRILFDDSECIEILASFMGRLEREISNANVRGHVDESTEKSVILALLKRELSIVERD